MDVSVNKPAKAFMRKQFQLWYCEERSSQLEGEEEIEDQDLCPVDLNITVMKEIGVQWLVDMAEYISGNPQFIVNGFLHCGITAALDGKSPDVGIEDAPDSEQSASEQSETDDKEDNLAVDFIV